MKTIDEEALRHLVARARESTRKRMNLNLHEQLSDPVQRLLNAGEPGTYTRPHRHAAPRWELFALLCGTADVLLFTDHGVVADRIRLGEGGNSVLEVPGGRWHSVVFASPGTVLLEVKPGPYDARTDKEFAVWAPAEGEPGAKEYMELLASAGVGSASTRGFGASS